MLELVCAFIVLFVVGGAVLVKYFAIFLGVVVILAFIVALIMIHTNNWE